MFVPVALGHALGDLGAGMVASMGGFTALYGRDFPYGRRRALHLLWIALGLTVAVTLGRAVSTDGFWIIPIVALFAMATTAACHTFDIPPPGSYMFLLTCAAASGMPDPALTPTVAASLVAGGAIFAWLIQMSGILSSTARARTREGELSACKKTSSDLRKRIKDTFTAEKTTSYVILRVGIAAFLSGAIASLLGIQRIYWAIAVAVVVLNKDIAWEDTLLRSLERALGTWLGIILACGILLKFPQGYWLALLIGVLQFVIELLVPRRYLLAVIFITCAGVTLGTGGEPPSDVFSYALARGFDTLIGAVVAVFVYKMIPADREKKLL